MRIDNFLENRQILNYHCPDHRSKVFVEQKIFSICFRHNGLGKHTLYPGTKRVKICYIVLSLNLGKTNFILFCSKSKSANISIVSNISVNIDNQCISRV